MIAMLMDQRWNFCVLKSLTISRLYVLWPIGYCCWPSRKTEPDRGTVLQVSRKKAPGKYLFSFSCNRCDTLARNGWTGLDWKLRRARRRVELLVKIISGHWKTKWLYRCCYQQWTIKTFAMYSNRWHFKERQPFFCRGIKLIQTMITSTF